MNISIEVINSRRTECARCETEGVRVDTTAGEMVEEDATYQALDSDPWLMVDERGDVVCDDCAEAAER